MGIVADTLKSTMEPSEPQNMILDYFKSNEGKRLTVRDEKALKELTGDEDLRISKAYGMTSIEYGGYRMSGGNRGGRLIVSHDVKNVVMDADKLEGNNRRHFSARVERNQKRLEALENTEAAERLEKAAEALKAAQAEYDAAMEPFAVVSWKLEEAFGQKFSR